MEDKKIWNYLIDKIKNPFGVAALMGNLYVESKLNPQLLQSSYARKLGMTSEEYTNAVDTGAYSNFVRDSAGYGLVQWTYWSRKESLYKYAKYSGKSIGDLDMQLDFLWREINTYKTVMNAITTATDIREASDVVAKRYEQPYHQEEEYLANRAKHGQEFFDKFAHDDRKYVVATANVNIRLGNGMDYKRVGRLSKDNMLEWVATSQNDWHAVKFNGQVCWVSGEFSMVL